MNKLWCIQQILTKNPLIGPVSLAVLHLQEKKYWKDFNLTETISVIVREHVLSN